MYKVQYNTVHIYLSTHLQLAEWRQSDNKTGLDPANISCTYTTSTYHTFKRETLLNLVIV